eukprot:gene5470-976_t
MAKDLEDMGFPPELAAAAVMQSDDVAAQIDYITRILEEEEPKVSQLVSMGFPPEDCRKALRACDGKLNVAVDMIVSGNVPPVLPASNTIPRVKPVPNPSPPQPQVGPPRAAQGRPFSGATPTRPGLPAVPAPEPTTVVPAPAAPFMAGPLSTILPPPAPAPALAPPAAPGPISAPPPGRTPAAVPPAPTPAAKPQSPPKNRGRGDFLETFSLFFSAPTGSDEPPAASATPDPGSAVAANSGANFAPKYTASAAAGLPTSMGFFDSMPVLSQPAVPSPAPSGSALVSPVAAVGLDKLQVPSKSVLDSAAVDCLMSSHYTLPVPSLDCPSGQLLPYLSEYLPINLPRKKPAVLVASS